LISNLRNFKSIWNTYINCSYFRMHAQIHSSITLGYSWKRANSKFFLIKLELKNYILVLWKFETMKILSHIFLNVLNCIRYKIYRLILIIKLLLPLALQRFNFIQFIISLKLFFQSFSHIIQPNLKIWNFLGRFWA
jgi:hypothetical protein